MGTDRLKFIRPEDHEAHEDPDHSRDYSVMRMSSLRMVEGDLVRMRDSDGVEQDYVVDHTWFETNSTDLMQYVWLEHA